MPLVTTPKPGVQFVSSPFPCSQQILFLHWEMLLLSLLGAAHHPWDQDLHHPWDQDLRHPWDQDLRHPWDQDLRHLLGAAHLPCDQNLRHLLLLVVLGQICSDPLWLRPQFLSG